MASTMSTQSSVIIMPETYRKYVACCLTSLWYNFEYGLTIDGMLDHLNELGLLYTDNEKRWTRESIKMEVTGGMLGGNGVPAGVNRANLDQMSSFSLGECPMNNLQALSINKYMNEELWELQMSSRPVRRSRRLAGLEPVNV